MSTRTTHLSLGVPLRRARSGAHRAVWSPTRARSPRAIVSQERIGTLDFTERGGPMLVVAGVCGGAGTTTLAYLVAAASARASAGPVLLADLGGPAAAVSAYTRVESGFSIPRLAEHIAYGRRVPPQLFATAPGGLRVLAARPEFDAPVPDPSAREVLLQARAAHALTVLDAGALVRRVEGLALSVATHTGWVLPATPLGVQRAAMLFGAVHRDSTVTELILARSAGEVSRKVMADLADLADLRAAPLVLIPHVADPIEHDIARVIGEAATALQAIGCLLRR